MNLDTETINQRWNGRPRTLIEWACRQSERVLCTTHFGPFEAVILHLVTQVRPDLHIVWMDSGYATPATYRFADELTHRLRLNLSIYLPRRSRAHREAVEGPTPDVGDPRHAAFTREVKLEPFERALRELTPEVWITAVRAEQTDARAHMQPVERNRDGIIKVAPLLHWSTRQMHEYLRAHELPNNFDYHDPTKGEARRECGLHLQH